MLSNVIGTPFSVNVLQQLYQRAARNSTAVRSNEEVLFLANKTAWVRMVSSVDISLDNTINPNITTAAQTDLTKYYQRLGINDTSNYPDGTSLAKRWILEAGTSIYRSSPNPTTGIAHMDIDLRYGLGQEGAYGLGGIEQQGYRPMPGLTSVTIDTAGRLGSLRVANINFKVWNMNQLNVVEALYFRLGYSMLLEWGHTQYFTNNGNFVTENIFGIDDPFTDKLRKENIQQQIAVKAIKTDGNYDGMLGIVTNFTWSFNQEGGYDCTVKLIGLGAIMDTMRINQAYTLPTGLIRGYYNAQKLLRDAAAAKAAADYAAAHPAPAPTGGGGTVAFTPPPPPKNVGELFTIAQTYDPTQVSGLTLDDFKKNLAYYSATDYNWPSYYNATQNYYFKSANPTNATELNDKTYGLFLGKPSYVNFRSRSPVNLIGSTLYLDMAQITSFYKAYTNVTYKNLTQDAIDEFNQSYYTEDEYGNTQLLVEQITQALNRNLSTDFLKFTTADKSNAGYGGMVSVVEAEVGTGGATNVKKDFYIQLTYPGVSAPAIDPATGNIIGTYIPTRNQVFKAMDDFFSGARATSVGALAASSFKITNIETGTIIFAGNNKTLDDVPFPAKTANVPDNRRSIIITAKATITVKDVEPPFVATLNAPLGRQRANIPKKDLTFDLTIQFNNTAFIEAINPAPTTPPATNVTTTGNAGNTTGATNTSTTDQTNEAFESALTAMLAYVKTVTQAANKGGNNMLKKPYDLAEATRAFYKDGVLSGVLPPPPKPPAPPIIPPLKKPFVPAAQSKPFDLTKYAEKGFNASLMANPDLYGDIPPVDFAEMCKSYLVLYGQGGKTSTDIATARVYITLGYLLAFLNNMCLIYDNSKDLTTTPQANPGGTGKDKRPYVYIDFNPETNFCLTSPQQLSVDPLTCLIPFAGDNTDYEAIYQPEMYNAIAVADRFSEKQNYVSTRLPDFRTSNKDAGRYQGKIMNILLDVDYLIQTAHNFATADPEHSVNLKRFLETVMLDVNKALGNFNIFRVAYLDESNTIQIRDDQWSPNLDSNTILDRESYKNRYYAFKQVQGIYGGADISKMRYGQLPIFGAQSLARGFEFKTNLSTKLSSMIAISAQADSGSVNAKDPSPLAHLNQGYVDRYKPRIQNPSPGAAKTTSKKDPNNNDEAAANAFNTHIKSIYANFALNADVIETAKNYYIERSALVKTGDPITSAAPFIPADLEITIDGIGGIIMGQAFTVPEDRMPLTLRGDGDVTKVGFIVGGLTHTIENNQWLTKIKGQMIKLRQSTAYGESKIITQVQNVPAAPNTPAGGGGNAAANVGQNIPAGGTEEIIKGKPYTCFYCNKPRLDESCLPNEWSLAWTTDKAKSVTVTSTSYIPQTITKDYIPAFKRLADKGKMGGLVVAMIAAAINEGFGDKTTLAYTGKNPGNVGVQSDLGRYNPQATLEAGISLQWNAIFAYAYEKSSSSDWRTSIYRKNTTLIEYCWHIAPWFSDFQKEKKFCRSNLPKYQNNPITYAKNIAAYYHHYGATNVTLLTTLDELKNTVVRL